MTSPWKSGRRGRQRAYWRGYQERKSTDVHESARPHEQGAVRVDGRAGSRMSLSSSTRCSNGPSSLTLIGRFPSRRPPVGLNSGWRRRDCFQHAEPPLCRGTDRTRIADSIPQRVRGSRSPDERRVVGGPLRQIVRAGAGVRVRKDNAGSLTSLQRGTREPACRMGVRNGGGPGPTSDGRRMMSLLSSFPKISGRLLRRSNRSRSPVRCGHLAIRKRRSRRSPFRPRTGSVRPGFSGRTVPGSLAGVLRRCGG